MYFNSNKVKMKCSLEKSISERKMQNSDFCFFCRNKEKKNKLKAMW